jgi:pSer/pThr/pTyr-binding forkhead associated (FHA) protein
VATNYRLTIRRGPDAGQQHSLIADAVTLGRDPLADVVINDPEVSRQHARLIRRGDGFLVQDLGSTNGTFLDGQRLGGEPVPVAPGQVITIGTNISLVFEAEGEGAATVLASGVDEEEEMGREIARRGVGIYDFPGKEEPSPEGDDFPQVHTTPIEERQTILDYPSPPHDLSYQDEPEELLPDFGPVNEGAPPSQPYIGQQPAQFRAAPPPPPPSGPPPRSNRNRNLLLIVLVLLLLCCCCFILSGYYLWGDPLLEFFGLYS